MHNNNLRRHGDDQLAAQRHNASEAAREMAQLDEASVILVVQNKIREGRVELARQIWRDYRTAQQEGK